MSALKTKSDDAFLDVDETQVLQQPGIAELRRPGYLFQWFGAFLEGWFLSRSYQKLLIGLPFVLIAFGGPMFVWWLKSAPQDSLVASYESAVKDSMRADEPEKTGVYLESLVRLRPLRKEFLHQLAMHYINEGQPERAGTHLNAIFRQGGYLPTSLWLLQQAAEPDPVFPLSEESVDRHLDLVLQKEPLNPIANWQKAQRLIQTRQFKTAEDHLLKIVDAIPALGLPLAKVQLRLQRDEEQIHASLDKADAYFQKALLADGKDTDSRVQRTEVLLLKRDFSGAAELIAEGRQLNDNVQLKVANARLLAALASEKLKASPLNAMDAALNLLRAMQLNPDDPTLLRRALALRQYGVNWSPDQLQPSLDALQRQPEPTVVERKLLVTGLAATGQNQKALEVLAAVDQPVFADRILEADLLLREGQEETANRLLRKMLTEAEVAQDEESCLNQTRILLLLKRPADALRLIQDCQQRFVEASQQQVAEWQACFRQANLARYQERLAGNDFEDAQEAIQMLTDLRQGAVNAMGIVSRMLNLMMARPDFEPAVRATLKQLARSNRSGWQIYSLLGTYDLQLSEQQPDRLADALKSLELAYQSQKHDPMLMNNLAIALVRSNQDLKRAHELVEGAISELSNPVDALSTRAEIWVAEERWQEALVDLERALAERPNSANVRRLLVQVLTALGKPSLAAEHQEAYDQLTAPRSEAKDSASEQ